MFQIILEQDFLNLSTRRHWKVNCLNAGFLFRHRNQFLFITRGKDIGANFYADIIVDDKIILELKAKERLIKEDETQILNYLKATGIRIGLLINFGSKRRLEWKRFIR